MALRIKSSVDLKELEKYGWEYINDEDLWEKVPKWTKHYNYYNELYIYPEDRIIRGTHDETISISDEEIIKYGWIDDLKEANLLVEKVKE